MENLSHDEFIEKIVDEHRQGYGFVPFIGSGLSAPSGILMAQEFTDFLIYTLYLCCDQNWCLRSRGWPAYPDTDKLKNATDWIKNPSKPSSGDYIQFLPKPDKNPEKLSMEKFLALNHALGEAAGVEVKKRGKSPKFDGTIFRVLGFSAFVIGA